MKFSDSLWNFKDIFDIFENILLNIMNVSGSCQYRNLRKIISVIFEKFLKKKLNNFIKILNELNDKYSTILGKFRKSSKSMFETFATIFLEFQRKEFCEIFEKF